jgi:hypothetical protein
MQVVQEWQGMAVKLDKLGLSWRKIAESVDTPKSTVSDFLRKYKAVCEGDNSDDCHEMETLSYLSSSPTRMDAVPEAHDNSRILLISDMHIPYHHKGLLPFLDGLKTRYDPTRVICVGDELDKHALSFHDSDPDLDSAGKELERSLPVVAALKQMFPKMDIVDSNHGSMVYRKAKANGIPRRYIKSYNEVLGVDLGWKWHMDLTLQLPDGQWVYFHHGKSAEAVKVSQAMGMNHVCGHYHESFGIKYWANPLGNFWGMNIGCLIDDSSLAFAYNNVNIKRPVIGTGLIIDGVPILEAMPR